MGFSAQSLTTANSNTVITFTGTCNSAVITNTHATDSTTIDLWVSGKASTDIVATGTLINLSSGINGYAVTHRTAMVVDGNNATEAQFLNERVYKSDGTFVGLCTAVGSTTSVQIGGGTETNLADNDNLYVGNRYYVLNNVVIPNGTSLKLEGDEINYNSNNFVMLMTCSAVGVDVIFR
mgnify:FL=1|tara:strand:+ start:1319 stop:1855 length:537 start_codon:yes stop_codon:yes gene_type:complete